MFLLDHEIAVVGWGSDSAGQFWIGRNSWGSYWGEQGFFRVRMHKHNLGIEMQCSFATPDMKRDPKAHLAASPPLPKAKKGSYHNYAHPCRLPPGPGPAASLITSPLPHTYMAEVPSSYDIRDIGGVNFATVNKNQHIPQYDPFSLSLSLSHTHTHTHTVSLLKGS